MKIARVMVSVRGRAILCALLFFGCWSTPGSAAAAPSIVIRLHITGGNRFAATIKLPENTKNNFCRLKGDDYAVSTYDSQVQNMVYRKVKVKKPFFSVDTVGYKKNKSTYSNFSDITLFVGLPGHVYYNGYTFPSAKLKIHISTTRLSGTVDATRLVSYTGFPGKPINLKASWTCSRLIRG